MQSFCTPVDAPPVQASTILRGGSMPAISPIGFFEIIRPATVGIILAGLVVVVVLAILAFRANAASPAGPGDAGATVPLMLAAILVGTIGIPLAVSVTYAVLSLREGEPVEALEAQPQPQT